MPTLLTRFFAGLVVLICMSASAHAIPITYVYSAFGGSGSIGGTAFSSADFTVTAVADTDNIGSWCCSDEQNAHLSATIEIAGFSAASILSPSHTWHGGGSVGLGADLGVNWMTMNSVSIVGYDLATAFGPIADTFVDLNQFNNVSTSLGILDLSDSTLSGTFQAITSTGSVPVPGTLAIFGLALAGLFRSRCRRS